MFSILVSELTPEMLSKAEYWRIFCTGRDLYWADTRHRCLFNEQASDDGNTRIMYLASFYAPKHQPRCFPVSISLDGTEVRLECPRLPDEPLIAEWSDTVETTATLHGMTSTVDDRLRWRLEVSGIALTYWTLPPTPEHYPRRTCEGVWVWSTRR